MVHKQANPNDSDKLEVSDARWLYMTLGALIGLLITSTLIWVTGTFNFSGTDAAAKILVAAIALVGTIIGTTVTLLGLMVKHSLDDRNWVLQTEAEDRLKLDTAIKAVELFKSASGSASPAESAGALFALTRLGQSHFALRLLEELWPEGRIETPSAMWVINSALQSSDTGVVEMAATLLRTNSGRLLDDQGGKWWPSDYYEEVPSEMPFDGRIEMLTALIRSLLSADFDYWLDEELNGDIILLSNFFREDPSPIIRQSAAAYLAILLETNDPGDESVIFLSTGDFMVEEVRAEIEETYGSSLSAATIQHEELERKLGVWVKRAPYFERAESNATKPDGERE